MKTVTEPVAIGTWDGAVAVPRRQASLPVAGHIEEIDGLRAVAILSVLVYHVGGYRVQGGFVGVDVFFVISGYLITRLLLADMDKGGISLAKFYERRILRIAPALFATLAGTAVIFFLLLPPVLSAELRASLVAAVFSYSNLWFYSTVDYFGNGAANPVLHTWSLAVEEQFYFFFPLLLLLVAKSRSRTPRWVLFSALALVSLVAAGATVVGNQSGAFYFPWLRAWELMVGAILAAVSFERLTPLTRSMLSSAGLLLIVAACLLYDEKTLFPGYAALLPCLGAAGVVAGSGSGGVGNALLRTRFMRWTGQISYSLYLVHWPLTCLAAVLLSLSSVKVQAAVIVASFVAGWTSWRYVETPFRRMAGRVSRRRVFLVFGACCLLLPVFFVAMQALSQALWRGYPEAVRYSEALRQDLDFFRQGVCFLSPKHDRVEKFGFDHCLKPDATKPNVLVLGDSHAANIVTSMEALHPSVNILQATAAACRPALGAEGAPHCRILDQVYREWLPKSGARVGTVVLAARWQPVDIEPLKATIAYLHGMGKEVIVYGPTPEYFVSVPLILAYEQIGATELAQGLQKQERMRLDEAMRKEIAPLAAYFSPMSNLCRAGACRLVEKDAPLLFDRDHLTPAGAREALRGFPLP